MCWMVLRRPLEPTLLEMSGYRRSGSWYPNRGLWIPVIPNRKRLNYAQFLVMLHLSSAVSAKSIFVILEDL